MKTNLAQAQRDGYVITGPDDVEHRVSNQWWRLCKAARRPFVKVELRGRKYAAVSLDMYPVDAPAHDLTPSLADEAAELLKAAFLRARKEGAMLFPGTCMVAAGAVLRTEVNELAVKLLGIGVEAVRRCANGEELCARCESRAQRRGAA
jgi:hypothetical protein